MKGTHKGQPKAYRPGLLVNQTPTSMSEMAEFSVQDQFTSLLLL